MFTYSRARWSALLCFMIALLFVEQILATPTPLGFDFKTKPAPPANSHYEKTLINAFVGANKQIEMMKAIVTKAHTNDKAAKDTLIRIFNDKYNLDEISKIVQKLEITQVNVIDWNADLPNGVVARAAPGTENIIIGRTFYTGRPAEQIAAIIHESTHLFGTFDRWHYLDAAKTVLAPIPINLADHESISGYMEQGFWDVYYHGGSMTYKNADSWALFGFYLEYHGFPPPPHLKVKPPKPVPRSGSKSPTRRT